MGKLAAQVLRSIHQRRLEAKRKRFRSGALANFDEGLNDHDMVEARRTGNIDYDRLMRALSYFPDNERHGFEIEYLRARYEEKYSETTYFNAGRILLTRSRMSSDVNWSYVGGALIDGVVDRFTLDADVVNICVKKLVFGVREIDGEIAALRNAYLLLESFIHRSASFSRSDCQAILTLVVVTLELATITNVKLIIKKIRSILGELGRHNSDVIWLKQEVKAQLLERGEQKAGKIRDARDSYLKEVESVQSDLSQGRFSSEWPYLHRGRINAHWNYLLMLQHTQEVEKIELFLKKFEDDGQLIQRTNLPGWPVYSALAPRRRSGEPFDAQLFADQYLIRSDREHSLCGGHPEAAIDELERAESKCGATVNRFPYFVNHYRLKAEAYMCMGKMAEFEKCITYLNTLDTSIFSAASSQKSIAELKKKVELSKLGPIWERIFIQ